MDSKYISEMNSFKRYVEKLYEDEVVIIDKGTIEDEELLEGIEDEE